jgi:hypothetical protein
MAVHISGAVKFAIKNIFPRLVYLSDYGLLGSRT